MSKTLLSCVFSPNFKVKTTIFLAISFSLIFSVAANAQTVQPSPTPKFAPAPQTSPTPATAPTPKTAQKPSDPLKNFKYRLVGPFRGGRVGAVAGVPSQPDVYYFGATGGGVWKTTHRFTAKPTLFAKPADKKVTGTKLWSRRSRRAGIVPV